MSSTSGSEGIVKVLMGIQAILIGIIFALVAGILAATAGMILATAAAIAGGAFLTTVPVVIGIQKAITN